MPTLRTHLNELANQFAAGVLLAIRSASLEDLLGETGRERRSGPRASRGAAGRRHGGRLARRSPEDIAKTLASVVSLLKGKKDGLRAEQIRDALKLDRREVPRVLKEGLATKKLKAKGQRRATRRRLIGAVLRGLPSASRCSS
jgi:hypothetical protein